MYAPDFCPSQAPSVAPSTEERSVQPPTEELYQPHSIEKGVEMPEALLVMELTRPVLLSNWIEYMSLSTLNVRCGCSCCFSCVVWTAAAEMFPRLVCIAFLNSPCYETPKNAIKKIELNNRGD
jgi:hypothetical protein